MPGNKFAMIVIVSITRALLIVKATPMSVKYGLPNERPIANLIKYRGLGRLAGILETMAASLSG